MTTILYYKVKPDNYRTLVALNLTNYCISNKSCVKHDQLIDNNIAIKI